MQEPGVPPQGADPARRHGLARRLNSIRAGVLGADDGIVSTAAVVVGVAGATSATAPIALAGAAALVGGALSMALGEYVSVSSQRDTERMLVRRQQDRLNRDPPRELDRLVALYEDRGLTSGTARAVARELTASDALGAHLSMEWNIDQADVASPWHAAFASAASFTLGALLPFLTIILSAPRWRLAATFAAVVAALAVTGFAAAWIGGSPRWRATVRTTVGGALALAATFTIGSIFGTVTG